MPPDNATPYSIGAGLSKTPLFREDLAVSLLTDGIATIIEDSCHECPRLRADGIAREIIEYLTEQGFIER